MRNRKQENEKTKTFTFWTKYNRRVSLGGDNVENGRFNWSKFMSVSLLVLIGVDQSFPLNNRLSHDLIPIDIRLDPSYLFLIPIDIRLHPFCLFLSNSIRNMSSIVEKLFSS